MKARQSDVLDAVRRERDEAVACAVAAERDLRAARERIAELEGLLAMRGEA